jgi:hypothetical protein
MNLLNEETMQRQNMEAITLLRQGNVSDAIRTFQDAVRTLKACLPEKAELMINLEEPTSGSLSIRSVSIFDNEEAIARSLADTKDLFDFYPRAFEMLAPSCYSHYKRCIVVLLYNMAVAFDAGAVSTTDPSVATRAVQPAVQLYSSALHFASTNWDGNDLSAMRCVLLAVVNNLGRLQSLCLDYQKTRFCMTMAIDLLSSADSSQFIHEDFQPLAMSVGPFYLLNQNILTVAPSA